jgi:4-diphosphocytidyl-2C-methyl-D-erythritol kinase
VPAAAVSSRRLNSTRRGSTCSTADVYRAWDELGGPHHETNDLQAAAEHVEPRLVEFKRRLETAAAGTAILAGSGSSFAIVFDDAEAAEDARARIGGDAAEVGGSVWLASAGPVGVQIRS